MSLISVIICTHNPRRDYLERVIRSLVEQTLSMELWELLLIDNASNEILATEFDLSWHSNAHHIREEKLGLTPARLRGIKEAKAELLVFVDDDNVLDQNYLSLVLTTSKDWPFLGAWGGQILPEFEKIPPDWTKPYWWMLALREFERDKWSNLPFCYETTPCGAGLCVRRAVANRYCNLLKDNPKRANLDRKGKSLSSSGDLDLALTSYDVGLGTGQFVDLKLTHLIPAARLSEEYLLKLAEIGRYSTVMMEFFRGRVPAKPRAYWKQKILNVYHLSRMDSRSRRFYQAFQKGETSAIQEIFEF